MQTIDFNRSYLRFRIDLAAQPAITLTHKAPTTVNNVRINMECRCELLDRQADRSHVYILCASCKTERVGVDRDCWLEPNADFCLVASDDEFLVMKSWACTDFAAPDDSETSTPPLARQSGLTREAWPKFELQFRAAHGTRLTSVDEIIASIRGDQPIVAHTEYDDGDFRVRLDYPVKTINYSERDDVYQTDTGPLLLPDLSAERLQRCEQLIDCFDLAYSAFNSADWAEFIINVPTPVGQGISVDHYSKTRRIEAVENCLIEVMEEDRPPQRRALAENQTLRADGKELPYVSNGAARSSANVAAGER
jgi:hypothetical protein